MCRSTLYSLLWTNDDHTAFVNPSNGEHLVVSTVAIMNNAAVTSHVYRFCMDSFSFLLAIYLGMKLLSHTETVWVLRNCQAIFHSGYKGDPPFSVPSPAHVICLSLQPS